MQDRSQEILVTVRTVGNWNKLPELVNTSRNGDEFKNRLKKL
jgi:hypothetical protein